MNKNMVDKRYRLQTLCIFAATNKIIFKTKKLWIQKILQTLTI